MENPIRIRRLAANYTIDQLAARAGVTHDHIIRNEQGLFTKPSPKVLGCIIELSGDTSDQIVLEYENWVAHQRRQEPIRSLVKRTISFDRASKLRAHPFLLWRTAIAPGVSRIAFCQMIACHPATVLRYEKGLQRPMPSQIFKALQECGMDSGKLHQLATLGCEYFDHQRSINYL